MLVRDDQAGRAYVQQMKHYKSNPTALARELEQRKDLEKVSLVAQNLTILQWSDFRELGLGPGWDQMSTKVKRELEHRIV
jgi:hypothetical protein